MPGLDRLSDIFKLKYRAPRPVFCPKCGSHKMKIKEGYGVLPRMYHCEECDYEGPLFLEIEEE